MRKRAWIPCVIAFVVFILLLWLARSKQRAAVEQGSVDTTPTVQTEKGAPFSGRASQPTSNAAAVIERRINQIQAETERGLNEWRAPIEFYGKVIDENTNAVAGANVHFVWTDLSPTGNSEKDTVSDQDGLFSLNNTTGKNLIVRVSKEGYYAYQPFGAAFNYAGDNQNFIPDAANAVIFRLKKKGVGEPLVTFEKTVQISISGKPFELDLRTETTAAPGHGIVMTYVKKSPENGGDRRYDWNFQIPVPNGGLIRSTNEFDFVAPENGYQRSDSVEMKTALGNDWQSRMKRQYFVRLPDGKYARVILDLMSHNGSLKVQAYINPSGSRNLEPK